MSLRKSQIRAACQGLHNSIKKIARRRQIAIATVNTVVEKAGGRPAFVDSLLDEEPIPPKQMEIWAIMELFEISFNDLANPTEWLKRPLPKSKKYAGREARKNPF